jgi:hypothetical protein
LAHRDSSRAEIVEDYRNKISPEAPSWIDEGEARKLTAEQDV